MELEPVHGRCEGRAAGSVASPTTAGASRWVIGGRAAIDRPPSEA